MVEAIVDDAAPLIAEVPLRDGEQKRFDPRTSTVAAAQFLAALDYTAKELVHKAERIALPPSESAQIETEPA